MSYSDNSKYRPSSNIAAVSSFLITPSARTKPASSLNHNLASSEFAGWLRRHGKIFQKRWSVKDHTGRYRNVPVMQLNCYRGEMLDPLDVAPKRFKECILRGFRIHRAREAVMPIGWKRSIRHRIKTPCVKTAYCMDCSSPARICNVWTIHEKSYPKGRIKVILINQDLDL